jgi:hypothetical protein
MIREHRAGLVAIDDAAPARGICFKKQTSRLTTSKPVCLQQPASRGCVGTRNSHTHHPSTFATGYLFAFVWASSPLLVRGQ